jgi:SAM-dependent methyltransferase
MTVEVTSRFSSRVSDYIRFRPGYPNDIMFLLKEECGLTQHSVIADIGSGTGKSTEMFLQNGNKVFAVEPNDEMRHAAEDMLGNNAGFISINARAEDTSLADKSIDIVVAGQAFHWFDQAKTKNEFKRILNHAGFVILIWNERPRNQQAFMGEYDAFLVKYSTDYTLIDHRNIDEKAISAFYAPGTYTLKEFGYNQVFDFERLKGRYDSCSYAIPADDNRYKETVDALHSLFDKYQQKGKVVMEYDTKVFFGKMEA